MSKIKNMSADDAVRFVLYGVSTYERRERKAIIRRLIAGLIALGFRTIVHREAER